LRGLRARLAAWAALIALAATGLPGWWLSERAYRALRAEAFASQLALSGSLASEIDTELSAAIGAVESLASSPSLVQDRSRTMARVALVASAVELLDDLLVVDADGKILARAPFPEPPPALGRSERAALAAQARARRGQSVPTVSAVLRQKDGSLVLRLARFGGAFTVIGQLRLDAQGVGSLETLQLSGRGYAYLADEHGQPLLLPNLASRLNLDARSPAPLAFEFKGEPVVQELNGPRGSDLLAASPLSSLGWAVAVRRPLAEAEAGARHMRRELAIFTVFAVLACAALAIFLANPLVASLLGLAKAAAAIESGSITPEELEALPAPDEVGALSGALAHMTRVLRAQQKERERAHARALAAERRLARSERLASLGQLAAGLAHELNNPLMVIQGAAAEAQAGTAKQAKPWLERIRRESQRCSELVRELLDYARPKQPQRRRFDLAALAKESFGMARMARGDKAPAFELRLEAPEPQVVADRDQMQQVLLNLFSNGMDAMTSQGGGAFTLSLAKAAGHWRLRLQDQGPGIPARQREAIFRPFFTNKSHGTGLGLAIARNLLAGHGGQLRCVPAQGKGACFEAEWPVQGEAHGG
jgi:signal transduction histidine kinase